MEWVDLLIYDRTQADVARLKTLQNKGWDNMTEDERRWWLYGTQIPLRAADGALIAADGALTVGTGDTRGAYRAATLNRVGNVCAYLYDIFASLGYAVPGYVDLKTDWTDVDKPTATYLETYLATVAALKAVLSATQTIPDSMAHLTVEGANEIEKLLADVDDMISRLANSFVYSGMTYSGVIWSQMGG